MKIRHEDLNPPPTLIELAALAQLIAQRDPALMGPFLFCVLKSDRAMKLCRERKPTRKELAALRAMPHGTELIRSSRWGARWLIGDDQRARIRHEDLAPSPTVAELAALAQLIAQQDPSLMRPFLHSLCRSHRATTKTREQEPTDRELIGLRKLAHGAELLGSSRWSVARLRQHAAETAAALDAAIPPVPRAPKWLAADDQEPGEHG